MANNIYIFYHDYICYRKAIVSLGLLWQFGEIRREQRQGSKGRRFFHECKLKGCLHFEKVRGVRFMNAI